MRVRNVNLGQGRPKVCVPVMIRNREQAMEDVTYILDNDKDSVDLLELRIDCYPDVMNFDVLKELFLEIREKVSDMPLLCTFRTFVEGGERNITEEEYLQLLTKIVSFRVIDLIDVELMRGEHLFEEIAKCAKEHQVLVVASNHDFAKTPSKDEMVAKLFQMERAGADIAKIAVMPKDSEDVLRLLSASVIAKTCIDIPIITIAMGKVGMLSRMAGSMSGSCLTFAQVKQASAPGQMDARELRHILDVLEK